MRRPSCTETLGNNTSQASNFSGITGYPNQHFGAGVTIPGWLPHDISIIPFAREACFNSDICRCDTVNGYLLTV